MELDELYQKVYEQILESERVWKINGQLRVPSYDDVAMMVERLMDQVHRSSTSISIESGGLLVKRTDDYIDVYVHVGGINDRFIGEEK